MILWIVAVAVYLLDRWTKVLISTHFIPGQSEIVVPHLLWFTYVQNTHGAFGLFGSQPVLLIGLALVVLALFAYAFRDAVRTSLIVRIAFGAIVGGAVAASQPAPVYVAPAGPPCRWVRERYWDGYDWRYRRVQYCD